MNEPDTDSKYAHDQEKAYTPIDFDTWVDDNRDRLEDAYIKHRSNYEAILDDDYPDFCTNHEKEFLEWAYEAFQNNAEAYEIEETED